MDSDARTPLHLASQAGNPAIVALICQRQDACLILNAQDVHGDTALHLVRDSEAAMSLLEAGADPDIPNLHGLTALHAAIGRRDERVLSVLLAHNADPNLSDELSR